MENLIEELTKVNPANLSEEGLKLFNKIMEIIDKNEEFKKNNEKYKIQLTDNQYIKIIESVETDINKEWKSKVRELQDKYKSKIEKLESKKIWNEPVDTINKNRYTNYYNAYEELLQEGDK